VGFSLFRGDNRAQGMSQERGESMAVSKYRRRPAEIRGKIAGLRLAEPRSDGK